jgi:hypothetical protein
MMLAVNKRRAENINFKFHEQLSARGIDLPLALLQREVGWVQGRLPPWLQTSVYPRVVLNIHYPWVNWECFVLRRTFGNDTIYGGVNVEMSYEFDIMVGARAENAQQGASLDAVMRMAVLLKSRPELSRVPRAQWRVVLQDDIPVPFFVPRFIFGNHLFRLSISDTSSYYLKGGDLRVILCG